MVERSPSPGTGVCPFTPPERTSPSNRPSGRRRTTDPAERRAEPPGDVQALVGGVVQLVRISLEVVELDILSAVDQRRVTLRRAVDDVFPPVRPDAAVRRHIRLPDAVRVQVLQQDSGPQRLAQRCGEQAGERDGVDRSARPTVAVQGPSRWRTRRRIEQAHNMEHLFDFRSDPRPPSIATKRAKTFGDPYSYPANFPDWPQGTVPVTNPFG